MRLQSYFRFNCCFGYRIICLKRNVRNSSDRTDIDDSTCPLLSHIRKDCLVHIHHTKEVYFKLSLCIAKLSEFNCAGDAVTSTVYQNADPAVLGNTRNHRIYGCFICYIDSNMVYSLYRIVPATKLIHNTACLT